MAATTTASHRFEKVVSHYQPRLGIPRHGRSQILYQCPKRGCHTPSPLAPSKPTIILAQMCQGMEGRFLEGLDLWDSLDFQLRELFGFLGCVLGPEGPCPPEESPDCLPGVWGAQWQT